MAGRRLLDAVKLFSASRAVAKQHLALRSRQLDEYSKTSTLAKSVKGQTDRVVLTAKAAVALAQRLNSSDVAYSAAYSGQANQQSPTQQPIPRQEDAEVTGKAPQPKEGIDQDHHYERPTDNKPAPDGQLDVQQEKAGRYPLPDGTIPPNESMTGNFQDQEVYSYRPKPEPAKRPLSGPGKNQDNSIEPAASERSSIPVPETDRARMMQRMSEFQIPSKSAESQPSGPATSVGGDISGGHDSDLFYLRSTEMTPELSSLPRFKIPGKSEDGQASDEHVRDEQINADVFYKSQVTEGNEQMSKASKISKQNEVPDEVPEGVDLSVFHNPRIAKMLGGSAQDAGKPKGPGRQGFQRTSVEPRTTQGKDQDNFSVAQPTTSHIPNSQKETVSKAAAREATEQDVKTLAADLAKDVDATTPKLPADADSPTSSQPYQMRESRVPSSAFGRLWQYGGLATSMAFGAVGESFRRVTGGGMSGGSLMLSEANMERLVAKLSRMRGAALKLGQMMSFQDSKMLPAPIRDILTRVQDSADYMPAWQRDRVLAENLGPEWRDLFSSFEEMPMAAASIGQVHKAVMKSSGLHVAVKVQYPGVADSIDSDLNNLSVLLTASRLLPKGLYLEKTIANARVELAWECDYVREAECGRRFRELLRDEGDIFTVPAIVDEASGKQVLTAELMDGIGVTKINNFSQEQHDWIGTQILRLCLRELTEFKFMQTDPNWTNFLYNRDTNKLELLDFGASRDYPDHFIDRYIRLLQAASKNDRETCRDLSIELGYLTGHESKKMLNAHLASMFTLAEPFNESSPEVYDFKDQTITERVKALIPVMLRERLAPPPEETYSLHRKLSGAFLLCARLGSRVRCREMFRTAMERYLGRA